MMGLEQSGLALVLVGLVLLVFMGLVQSAKASVLVGKVLLVLMWSSPPWHLSWSALTCWS